MNGNDPTSRSILFKYVQGTLVRAVGHTSHQVSSEWITKQEMCGSRVAGLFSVTNGRLERVEMAIRHQTLRVYFFRLF